MYAYIKGVLIAREAGLVIVENNGIGYKLNIPAGLVSTLPEPGSEVLIHTHLNVREDVFELYGFPKKEQVKLFQLLITVNGIGPKLAMAIVDQLPTDRFAMAVLNEDIKTLTTVKGLGKKGAERLVLEIRDKVKANLKAEGALLTTQAEMPEAAQGQEQDSAGGGLRNDVIAALLVLGFSTKEANTVVGQTLDPGLSLEENISKALRSTAKV